MSSRWFTRLLLATVIGVLCWSAAALADPASRVARLSFIGGSVSLRPASVDDWSVASLNYPLTIGDHLWTDREARAELQLGSTVVRLAPLTAFSVLNLDDHTAQLRITQGAMSVRVRALGDRDVIEIDTPNGAVSVLRAGLYRVDVDDAGEASTVTVREGEADVAAGTTAFPVRRDQSAVLTGIDAPRFDIGSLARSDDFDDWCFTRDRRASAIQATRYISPEMIGYEDLDANGNWLMVAEYGPVWIPRVNAGWAPYRFGHWVWAEPWGWTWIDDAPWGFAPFHYGRWAFLPARGWAWVPGRLVARPVYAPALVAFVGGSHWNLSVTVGNEPIGWFPLGPREVFVPAYHVTPEYLQRVNDAHVTNVNVTTINVTNITYVNRTVPGAITAVSRDTFVQARPVAPAAVAIPRDEARAASVVATVPVAPQRASIGGPPQRTATPPATAVTRQVIVRSAPPPLPAPFAAKQAALAQHPGQPVDESAENAARGRTPPASMAHPLVRAVASPRPAPASSAGTGLPQSPVRTLVPSASASAPTTAVPARPAATTGATERPVTVARPGDREPRPTAPPAAPPPPSPSGPTLAATPGVGAHAEGRSASPRTAPNLTARQAQERADLDARQAHERAVLQAKQELEQKQVTDPPQRVPLQKRHAQEMKTLLDRQKSERDAMLKRHQEDRAKSGSDRR